jgi:hypothetical protein
MLKKMLLTLCVLFMVGCSAKHQVLDVMPIPQPGTREALLPTYEPTGSACLDSIVVNMLYSGCSDVRIAKSREGANLMGCVMPQPGAQDIFSMGTFVHATDTSQIPAGAQPFCGDPTGIYAMWGVPFSELVRDE